MAEPQKRLLHVGCGAREAARLPPIFLDGTWDETRLDNAREVEPDLVAPVTDMSVVPAGSFDAVFSSHDFQRLHAHEVPMAARECARVLAPDGFALILCPDLQSVAQWIADGDLYATLYEAPAGPIAPIDIIFGYRPELERGNVHIAHRTGFSQRTLAEYLVNNGFAQASVRREPENHGLVAIGFREDNPNIVATGESDGGVLHIPENAFTRFPFP
jgi:SAM-dependent methyltransferase